MPERAGIGQQRPPCPLWSFGLVFTLVAVVAQVFTFIAPTAPSAGTLRRLPSLVPIILLLTISNGPNEEIILRAAPIAPTLEVVDTQNAVWMAAVLFGLSHYIGRIPSGILCALITTFPGWFFRKCVVVSKNVL